VGQRHTIRSGKISREREQALPSDSLHECKDQACNPNDWNAPRSPKEKAEPILLAWRDGNEMIGSNDVKKLAKPNPINKRGAE
jgi:hypothetical protein